MTYREYMMNHPDENMHFCQPYASDDEDRYIIMYDGEADAIKSPDLEAHRFNGGIREHLNQFVRDLVGEDYELHHGYSDEEIALHYMHPIGCAACPFRDECEALDEEIPD